MKNLFRILPLILLIGFASCKKDDPKKTTKCSNLGTVVFLPLGCVANSTTLGVIDDKGNYFYIENDLTKTFSQYNVVQVKYYHQF
jgi:hypothetical protein